ncbi:hypothetical protein SAMN05421796_1066 [Chryseobacterium piscicola]|uniref:Uncharacterized protein n=1 Tax=Chryseobacterium piscicola TaxID=551459 RepID=A0A1N7MXP3_9FLAO|nr:hypothetical protein [Chryseobacterium piscicola]PQA93914.1 hypothetical protein B0A70_09010 [Chryseobacterium piscicola]SIS90788.1 hypothetical protein SAMN05421796_1066 [Chryseobacterium piscicola]
MENKVYNWLVKKGTISVRKNGDLIMLQLDYENGESCLLTRADNDEIIQLLTTIAEQIWENPNYERKPYTKQLYEKIDNDYYWEINGSKLIIRYNENENATEIRSDESKELNIEINYIIEIVQILEHLSR